MTLYEIHVGNARALLADMPAGSVHTVVTSPPYYGLRDYGVDGQIGLEATPAEYLAELVGVFREVRRVLRDDGTLWLNLGDSYAGSGKGPSNSAIDGDRPYRNLSRIDAAPARWMSIPDGAKPKDLLGIPWRVAFALQADGWYLRSDIIWHKPNPMPESVTDRPTKAHEYLFLLSKSERYFYNHNAIREPASHASIQRWRQNIDAQAGSDRVPGKTNGPMKAAGGPRRRDKQRGHGRRHAGFNDRWDAMTKAEQAEMGRNKRTVWTVATRPYSEAHFATYPPELIKPCILAGAPLGGTVLDPFSGSGTTGEVALKLDRRYIGIELNPEYAEMSRRRLDPIAAQGRLFSPQKADSTPQDLNDSARVQRA